MRTLNYYAGNAATNDAPSPCGEFVQGLFVLGEDHPEFPTGTHFTWESESGEHPEQDGSGQWELIPVPVTRIGNVELFTFPDHYSVVGKGTVLGGFTWLRGLYGPHYVPGGKLAALKRAIEHAREWGTTLA